jgi:4-amino-4-deoxy-L-arabinose transferase-like glycosyltransferase
MNAISSRRTETAPLNPRRGLIVVLAVTLLGRVIFLGLFSHTLSLQTSGYDTYATNVMNGHGYTRFPDRTADTDLPPLYPFFLVTIYTLFGRSPIPVAGVQIGLDLATAALIYWIGKRIAGEKAGLLAAVCYGLYPYLLFQGLTVNDTSVFVFLLAAGIGCAYRARDTGRWRWAIALGGIFGLAALTKTFILVMLPLLWIWWWTQAGLRQAVKLSLASGLMLLAVITPWVIRNISVQKEIVFISTNGGSNFHQGNNPCVADFLARGWDAQWVDCLGAPPAGLSEVGEDRWHTQQAVAYLREHPEAWPRLFGIKLLVLWSPAITPSGLPPQIPTGESAVLLYHTPMFMLARVVHELYFGPLLVLGLAGWIWAWRKKLSVGPPAILFAVITTVYVVFHPSTRYRSPADPFLFIFSAYMMIQLWEQAKLRLRRS